MKKNFLLVVRTLVYASCTVQINFKRSVKLEILSIWFFIQNKIYYVIDSHERIKFSSRQK